MPRFLLQLFVFGLAFFAFEAFAEDTEIKVGHSRLDPSEVTISAGDTITFHNEDQMPGGHSIVVDDGAFKSPALAEGDTWSHTFGEPGTHDFHIGEHPDAKGTITVN